MNIIKLIIIPYIIIKLKSLNNSFISIKNNISLIIKVIIKEVYYMIKEYSL
jgi:hypothetical protein